jgi:hypothetical protein
VVVSRLASRGAERLGVAGSRHSSRFAWLETAVLAGTVALIAGCSSSIPERTLELDCSVNDDYDFLTLQPMEGADDAILSWFSYGDMTPRGVNLNGLKTIPGGRCGSTSAMVFTVNRRNDWGAGFGEYQTSMLAQDAREYEGVSFWARAAGYGTSTGFTLNIGDRNTYNLAGNIDPNGPVCKVPDPMDAVSYTVNEAGMLVPVGGDLPGRDDCGNVFARVVTAHREWSLHLLPFESFQQLAQPNRKPEGLDRSAIYQFSITVPKDSNLELWLDDLSLYRRRAASDPATAESTEQ